MTNTFTVFVRDISIAYYSLRNTVQTPAVSLTRNAAPLGMDRVDCSGMLTNHCKTPSVPSHRTANPLGGTYEAVDWEKAIPVIAAAATSNVCAFDRYGDGFVRWKRGLWN
jgi:hypothetical protein